jgi:hypothetical protein
VAAASTTSPSTTRLAYARAMTNPHKGEDDRRKQAQEALDRVRAESETIGGSTLGRVARRTADHFAAKDAIDEHGQTDPIELWGRRIGRALSLAGVIGLSIYLYLTYVR